MSFSDKLQTRSIMINLKKEIDNAINCYYPILQQWANLSVRDIVLNETRADIKAIKKL